MKVKVSPSYDGAGSWTTDCVWVAGKWRDEETLAEYPASWCEPIPEMVPEPGDICEFWCEHTGRYIARFVQKDGAMYEDDKHKAWTDCRVLARKPKGFEEARKAIKDFGSEWCDSDTEAGERDAYETFLCVILVGAEYGRVDK